MAFPGILSLGRESHLESLEYIPSQVEVLEIYQYGVSIVSYMVVLPRLRVATVFVPRCATIQSKASGSRTMGRVAGAT
jgi:hypothetical protein